MKRGVIVCVGETESEDLGERENLSWIRPQEVTVIISSCKAKVIIMWVCWAVRLYVVNQMIDILLP